MPTLDLTAIPDIGEGREARLVAAATLESTGDKSQAAIAAGVSQATLDGWLAADWWPVAAEAARQSFNESLTGQMAGIAKQALGKLAERISRGDEQMDRNGKVHTVEVGAKDLAVISALMVDKRQLVAGKPTSISGTIAREELLAALRQQGKEPKAPVPEAPPPQASPLDKTAPAPTAPAPAATVH
jgi:hypothetical protein